MQCQPWLKMRCARICLRAECSVPWFAFPV